MLCMQDGEGMSVAGAGPGKLTGLLVPPDLTLTYCLFSALPLLSRCRQVRYCKCVASALCRLPDCMPCPALGLILRRC